MIPARLRPWIAVVATALLVALALALPPDGAERGPAALALAGRWHLVALHLPAALLLLIPLAELVLREREPSRALRLMGDVAAGGTWAAAALGILHARLNGFEGQGIDDHLWLGVACAALSALAWAFMQAAFLVRLPLQLAAALAVAAAGHVGGELVHGEGFLTRAPGAKPGVTAADTTDLASLTPAQLRLHVYETRVKPLLAEHCTACHDAKKQKGKLRMDSLAALEKGGSEGPALVWGKSAESLIVIRSSLPRDDEDSMPPEPKPMLTKAQLDLLRAWIDGVAPASLETPAKPGETGRAPAKPAAFRPNAELRKVAARLAEREGLTALPRALDTDAGLVVAAHAVAGRFDDAALARLASDGAAVAELDLSRSRLTDAAAPHLATFTHLESLLLNETQVGDALAKAAAALPRLERLALRGTALTDAGLAELARSTSLRAVFVGQTRVTAEGVAALRSAKPDLRLVAEVPVSEKSPPQPPTKEEMRAKAAAAK
jgi:hypothetical protein